ncbi:hypothetical protein B0T18DRAFT_489865 [Schizothecium vesticola]|uniref:Large ribosomal subunit protein mL50 n=1 Tax=Schizothecium vesticola TaxID=314040 RepID=A0AA40EPD9_9PEZI|nr:hypothetical protein B0T18DRAFT_489865 [Schizothecium vesticola]
MRGLQRLRGPASCLSTCTATAPRTTPFLRQLSTSASLHHQHLSRPTPRATSQLRQRNASTATTIPTETEPVESGLLDEEPAPFYTDLVLPGERTEAAMPDQITDADYVPAVSAVGLEEVGGLDGWWDRPGNWGESKQYQGFGPREKVMDKSMLEVLTRQALIEAVILHHHKRPTKVTLPGPEVRRSVLLAEITVGPEGEPTLAPEVRKMVLALGRSRANDSAVAREKPAAEEEHVVEEKAAEEALENNDVADEPAGLPHELNPVEARRLSKQWDSSWKSLKLENPVLKFWLGRRITELTGHRIMDFKMTGLSTPASIINHLAQPTKTKKLVEELEAKGLLAGLPNVTVFAKRVGPVDKERMVGRWKIIEKELTARGLPVLGTGDHRKAVERRWITGDEYRGFFSQDPKATESEDESAADAIPRGLKAIADEAKAAWSSSPDDAKDDMAALAEMVADACRQPSWRRPAGDSGLLAFFLTTILPSPDLSQSLQKQSLRLVGNACAECEENQERAVESGQLSNSILGFLKAETSDYTLLPFALAVIYNIAMGNSNGIIELCTANLSRTLLDLFKEEKESKERFKACRGSLNMIIELFESIVATTEEPEHADPHTPHILFDFAVDRSSELDIDEFTGIMTIALAYLTFEDFQRVMVESDEIQSLLRASYESCLRLEAEKGTNPEAESQIQQFWTAAASVYADISSLPAFQQKHAFGSGPEAYTRIVETFFTWLAAPKPYHHLQTVACLCLGNLARSDDAAVALLPRVAPALVNILARAIPAPSSTTPPPVLLHAALGSLKNLAIPAHNKPLLSDGLLWPTSRLPTSPVLSALWSRTSTNPQVQFTVISLTRLLLTSNPSAVLALCTTPAHHTPPLPTPTSPTDLHLLLTAALASPAEPTRLEAARALAAVLRTLHVPLADLTALLPSWPSRAALYAAHAAPMADALATMLTHAKAFPTMRAEALFLLALLSRSPDGGRLALDALRRPGAFRAAVETMTGRKGDEVAALLGDLSLDETSPAAGADEGAAAVGYVGGAPPTPGNVDMSVVEGLGVPLQPRDGEEGGGGMVRRNWENGMLMAVQLVRLFGEEMEPARVRLLKELFEEGRTALRAMRAAGGE